MQEIYTDTKNHSTYKILSWNKILSDKNSSKQWINLKFEV